MNAFDGNDLFRRIKQNDEKAFGELFTTFYPPLCNYALQFVGEHETAEEITQDIFVRLWEKRSALEIEMSP